MLQLGPSVPTLVALVKGDGDTEAQLSREYGGTAGEGYTGGAVPLYIAIGNVRQLQPLLHRMCGCDGI